VIRIYKKRLRNPVSEHHLHLRASIDSSSISKHGFLQLLPISTTFYEQLCYHRAFHRFGQAKFPDGGSVLALSQFSRLYQLPPKILLDSKVVKIDPKIIISLR